MRVTPAVVAEEREWVRERAPVVVAVINETRDDLGEIFEAEVGTVDRSQYLQAVDDVFADGDLAVNVAALVRLLRSMDVEADYPGFVVDELLGRELAGMIAGTQPLRLLGEATFHYADVHTHAGERPGESTTATVTDEPGEPGETAGLDDLDAALAAGFQTRLPGWSWHEGPSQFSLEAPRSSAESGTDTDES